MATSRSIISPWRLFKRLNIQPSPPVLLRQRAPLSTSSSKPAEVEDALPEEEDKKLYLEGESKGQTLSASPQDAIRASLIEIANSRNIPLPPSMQDSATNPRLPRSVQALYLAPLRRTPTHGIPVCNLQLRSYSVRNLEFMADFALRAAYYLNLPAKGPVPLPKITQRWTVPRDNFIFKKSQENYERVTVRRLIQIQDGNPEVVRRWLGFVRRHVWYGVGMKADVFEFESTDVVKNMDENEEAVRIGLEKVDWSLFGRRKGMEGAKEVGDAMAKKGWAEGPVRRKVETAEVTAPKAVEA